MTLLIFVSTCIITFMAITIRDLKHTVQIMKQFNEQLMADHTKEIQTQLSWFRVFDERRLEIDELIRCDNLDQDLNQSANRTLH